MNTQNISKRGFTLLELLIVISIIAILSVILIVALNPAETLRKARDTQRISDMASMKTAIGIYTTTESSPILDGGTNTLCYGGSGVDSIWYSIATDTDDINDATLDAGSGSVPNAVQLTDSADLGLVDGNGWIPVALTDITGGSPISNLPIDPTNNITTVTAVDYDDLVYRYTCEPTNLTFEINAKLESQAFTTEDIKATKDGGDNATLYEVGTDLTLLGGTGAEF